MFRQELFDAAVNKALTYALRLGLPLSDRDKLRGGLELWYLKTRFAYRIPLEDVLRVLEGVPKAEPFSYRWNGGQNGQWAQKIRKARTDPADD